MKNPCSLLGVALLALGCIGPAAHAADVGVSIVLSQPGVYGRVDLGRHPPPVVYSEPVRVLHAAPEPRVVWVSGVPHRHRKKWHRHCWRYDACGVPVRFVRDGYRYERHERYGHDEGRSWRRGDHDD